MKIFPPHCLIWAKDVLLIITVCPEIRHRQEETPQISGNIGRLFDFWVSIHSLGLRSHWDNHEKSSMMHLLV